MMRRAPRRNASGVGITSGLLPVRRQFGSPPMGEIDMGIHNMQPRGPMQPQGPMNMGAPSGLNTSFTSMMDPSGGVVPNMGGTSIIPQGTDIGQMGLDVGGQQQAQAQEQVEQDDLAKNVDLTLTEIIDLLETYRETGNFSGMLKLVGNLSPEVIKLISSVTSEEDDFKTKVQKEKDVLAQVLGIDDDEGKMRPEMADFLMALGASLMSNKSGSGMSGAFSALGEAGMKALPTLTAGRKEKEALEKQIALSAYSTVSARRAAEAQHTRDLELKGLDVDMKPWTNNEGEIVTVNEKMPVMGEGSSILGYEQAAKGGFKPQKGGTNFNVNMADGSEGGIKRLANNVWDGAIVESDSSIAEGNLQLIDQFSSLLTDIPEAGLGPASRFLTSVQALGEQMGADSLVRQMNENYGKLGPKQAIESLTMAFVLQKIQQTKGAISEKEMNAFERASPTLLAGKQGNQILLALMRRKENLEIAYADSVTNLMTDVIDKLSNPNISRKEKAQLNNPAYLKKLFRENKMNFQNEQEEDGNFKNRLWNQEWENQLEEIKQGLGGVDLETYNRLTAEQTRGRQELLNRENALLSTSSKSTGNITMSNMPDLTTMTSEDELFSIMNKTNDNDVLKAIMARINELRQ